MPKPTRYILSWSVEYSRYELLDHQSNTLQPLQKDSWYNWLNQHSSFSFQGQNGKLSLLKEARARGGDYWYAYRSMNQRTLKKYAGRTDDLSCARLESIALTLASLTPTKIGDKGKSKNSATVFTSPAAQSEPFSGQLPQSPLFAYKLQLPRLPANLIEREYLLNHLDAAQQLPFTLIAAPAGFGKTTLVGQWWAHHKSSLSLAWVTLEEEDNNLVSFWQYVITACQKIHPEFGGSALAQLTSTVLPPFEPPDFKPIVGLLLNDLAQLSRSWVLVLDDYHFITETPIHQMLAFFLEHLPPSLHVIVISRGSPPLPLTRLRSKGELFEIGAVDLRFNQTQIALFLQQTLAINLSPETVTKLDTHLAGWPAGLRLLQLALRDCKTQSQVEQCLEHFNGSHQLILEYFVSQVLEAQPEHLQHFLLQTSELAQFNAALCDFITELTGGAEHLAYLEQADLFLETLDEKGKWFRYHPLFAEAMRTEAQRRLGQKFLEEIGKKASYWFESQGLVTEAIEAAFKAQDLPRALVLIGKFIGKQSLLELHRVHTVLLWLQQIPVDLIKYYPELCQHYAAALIFSGKVGPGQFDQVEKLLQMAEAGWLAMGNEARISETLTFRAMLANRQGDFQLALKLARQALNAPPTEKNAWRNISAGIITIGALQQGQLNEAQAAIGEVKAYWEATGNSDALRGITLLQAKIYYEQGALQKAQVCYQQVLTLAREVGDQQETAFAQLGLAVVAYQRNQLARAEELAREIMESNLLTTNPQCYFEAALLIARLEHTQGQSETALQRCLNLEQTLNEAVPINSPLFKQFGYRIGIEVARIQLAKGAYLPLQQLLISFQTGFNETLLPSQEEQLSLVKVRFLLIQHKPEEAQFILKSLLAEASKEGRQRTALEIQLLQALIHTAQHNLAVARRILLRVITQTYAEGHIRLFLDEGTVVATLIQTLIPQIHEPGLRQYAQSLVQAFGQAGDKPELYRQPWQHHIVEPLTSQERKVLAFLVAGHSNREIAQLQMVSINTVRTQVQSIYHKLGVNNRVGAIEMARQLQIL